MGEWESGHCQKSPVGAHHWKFGKCHYCQKAEGEIRHGRVSTAGDTWCASGGKCSFKSASCCKCGRVKGVSCEQRSSRHSLSLSPRPSSRCESLSPRPSSVLETPTKLEGSCISGRNCLKCGYRCLSWLDDDMHCLNCKGLQNDRSNEEIDGSSRLRHDFANDSLHTSKRRSSIDSVFRACRKSPKGAHLWNFGKCRYCQQAQRTIGGGLGSFSNPGGLFGRCTMGGKCICKFGSCVKCGCVEGILSACHLPDHSTCVTQRSELLTCENGEIDWSVPVGGSLQAIRKLQQSNCKAGREHDDQSTSAGSDDEEQMIVVY